MRTLALRTAATLVVGSCVWLGAAPAASADPWTETSTTEISTTIFTETWQSVHTVTEWPGMVSQYLGEFHSQNLSSAFEQYTYTYTYEDPAETPTEDPTGEPTEEPSEEPTGDPSAEPTADPTGAPSEDPTVEPTDAPTDAPADDPGTDVPAPTDSPTGS